MLWQRLYTTDDFSPDELRELLGMVEINNQDHQHDLNESIELMNVSEKGLKKALNYATWQP